jgi:hypothetical protein
MFFCVSIRKECIMQKQKKDDFDASLLALSSTSTTVAYWALD